MKYKFLLSTSLIIFSTASLAVEPPKHFSLQIKEEFDLEKNKNDYDSLVEETKKYQTAYLENESMGNTLGLICKKGLSMVKNVSPMIFKDESIEFLSEYEIQYSPITDFNPPKRSRTPFPTYDVECFFKTKKSDSLQKTVRVSYHEIVNIDNYKASYEKTVRLK